VPIEAPRASKAAARWPRDVFWIPAFLFLSSSCFSTRVALAGKMAGNARKRPPKTGPKCCATNPANNVIDPPKTKRIVYSYHLVRRSADNSKRTLIIHFLRNNSQALKAQANQTANAMVVAAVARNLVLARNWTHTEVYAKNAALPASIERASTAAYIFPFPSMVIPNVANAIEGAAPNNPAKLFGFKTSPRTAKTETTRPPTKKRISNCKMLDLPGWFSRSCREGKGTIARSLRMTRKDDEFCETLTCPEYGQRFGTSRRDWKLR
jgi:hypothetical protein